jgi:hypothetical protein
MREKWNNNCGCPFLHVGKGETNPFSGADVGHTPSAIPGARVKQSERAQLVQAGVMNGITH